MQRALARFGKQLAARAGLRVRRAGIENRFDGMRDALGLLRDRGYAPRLVVDGGANIGQWSSLAAAVFPAARFHLIEPQAACHRQLAASFTAPRFTIHPVALTEPGIAAVPMTVESDGRPSTGAAVVDGRSWTATPTVDVPATTLDALFASTLQREDRALLKLDLESHELAALRGATRVLPDIEVVVCEVSFYDVGNEGRPLFTDILVHLRQAGFVLYDVASLSGRVRDQRLRNGDAVFVHASSPLLTDVSWA